MEEFHSELDSFKIHLPGDNVTSFGRKEDLEHFFACQYPNWKEKGKVTSIPEARVPRLFLSPDQMTSSLKNRFRTLQFGESGEIHMYKLFLQTGKLGEDGILIFPNVDGNHFKSKIAHVEIDLVIIHPLKGTFIINIKNGKINLDEIANDVKKHGNFIFYLGNYRSNDVIIPLHSVVCSLKNDFDSDVLKSLLEKDSDKCFSVQPAEVKDFSNVWKSLLAKISDITNKDSLKALSDLAARLAALNSMEGSICLIHRKIASGDMQRLYKRKADIKDLTTKMTKEAFEESGDGSTLDARLTDKLTELQINEDDQRLPKFKKSIILWTKEQLDIIIKVCTRLLESNTKPLKVLISGPKGSGKTMLLLYLANLSKAIYMSQDSWKDDDITVADGRLGSSQILLEELKEYFDGSGINVFRGKCVSEISSKMVLFDECNSTSTMETLSESFRKPKIHVILFTSSSYTAKSFPSYEKMQLTNTSRATQSLVCFTEEFRCQEFDNFHIQGIPLHNLEGNSPDIRSLSIDTSKDPCQIEYITSSIAAIHEVMEKSKGLDSVLVTPYIHPITLERIIHEIQVKGYDFEFRNPLDIGSKSTPQYDNDDISTKKNISTKKSDFPKIVFVTGNHVDGAEFGSVIVLLERSLPPWWHDYIFNSLYISITRATVNLLINMNNTKEAPLISCKQVLDNASASMHEWFNIEASNVDIHSFLIIPSNRANFLKSLDAIVFKTRKSNGPILVFGQVNVTKNYKQIDPPVSLSLEENSEGNKIGKWFSVSYGSEVVLVDDFRVATYLQIYHHRYMFTQFSTIVFFVSSQAELEQLSQSNRHDFLFAMFEYQLATCPVHLVTSCFMPSKMPICDFLNSKSRGTSKVFMEIPEDTIVRKETWEAVKQQGTDFVKEGRLEDALFKYKDSLRILKQVYKSSLPVEKLKQVLGLREEMAKLCTNISKMLFDLGAESENRNLNKVEASLQFAEKSVEFNPIWVKGYHRIIQASEILGDAAKSAREKEKMLSENWGVRKMKCLHRNATIREIMQASLCWEFVKFKENSFLVDLDGGGHFTSIEEAIKSGSCSKPISLLVNPGFYKGFFLMNGEIVDIIGNCSVKLNLDNKWIQEDPPVVLQDFLPANTIIVADHACLYLRMVSVYHLECSGHCLFARESASVDIVQCSFSSKYRAAIAVGPQVSLCVRDSRSVKSYSTVLAEGNCSVTMERCLIQGTIGVGVELRQKISASIDNCTFKDCEGQGLSCIGKCDLTVNSCFFVNNGTKKGPSEGSIQLRETDAFISNSKIVNQPGCGIVIEYGRGEFVDLTIDRCKTGILTQAPIHMKKCTVKNCGFAVCICINIAGEIILEDNRIERCSNYYYKLSNFSPEPTVINNIGVKSPRAVDLGNHLTGQLSLKQGKLIHEKISKNRQALASTDKIYGPIHDVLGLDKSQRNPVRFEHGVSCVSCTLKRNDDTVNNFFLCSCEVDFYCSQKCAIRYKDMHKPYCESYKKCVEAYRKSINWKEDKGIREADKKDESSSRKPAKMRTSEAASAEESKTEARGVNAEESKESTIKDDGAGASQAWKKKTKKKKKSKSKF